MSEGKKVARVFEECTGKYHICDDDGPFLDARGRPYNTKADALRAAHREGYTHAIGSGCSWEGVCRIPERYRNDPQHIGMGD